MSAATKPKKSPHVKPVVRDEACVAADRFIAAKKARKEAEAAYDAAKLFLVDWLGPEPCKRLADGRHVHKSVTFIPAAVIERKAHKRTEVTVADAAAV